MRNPTLKQEEPKRKGKTMEIGVAIDIYSNGYSRWGDDRYKKLKEHGYSYIDFNMADTNTPIYTLHEAESRAIIMHEKKLTKEAGIGISQVHGPWRWPPADLTDEDRSERMEKMKKSIHLSSLLECRNWVIHPILPYGLEDTGTTNEKKTWELNLEFMSELLKTAKEYGVTICLENMPFKNFSIARPIDTIRFVRAMKDDNFKACLDTGHVATFPEISPGEAVKTMGKDLRVLHVHDTRYGMDLHLMPYFGVIDWMDFRKALDEIAFNGVLSLETLPSVKLDTDIFEEMCVALARIAARIAG